MGRKESNQINIKISHWKREQYFKYNKRQKGISLNNGGSALCEEKNSQCNGTHNFQGTCQSTVCVF